MVRAWETSPAWKCLLFCLLTYILSNQVTDAGECPPNCSSCHCLTTIDHRMAIACENYQSDKLPPCLGENTTSLTITASNIVELRRHDFASSPNLTFIQIIDNPHLRNIELGTFDILSKLTVLLLSGNRLEEFHDGVFRNLTGLLTLGLDGNRLTVINKTISGLRSLVNLNLAFNFIYSIQDETFSDMQSLASLNLSHNEMSSVDDGLLKGLSSLQTLSIQSNRLADISNRAFYETRALLRLHLDDNDLAMVSLLPEVFIPLDCLVDLSLSANRLTEFPSPILDLTPSIKFLNLSDNMFSKIPGNAFKATKFVEELHLSSLPNLREIENGAFSGLNNLCHLYLDHNHRLVELTADQLDPQNKFSLVTLSLSNCSIPVFHEDVFTSLPNLTQANISGNPLACSCLSSWIAALFKNSSAPWIQAWMKGLDAIRCFTPDNLNGLLVFELKPVDFTCLPPVSEANHTVTSAKNSTIQVVLSSGLPIVTWHTPDGTTLVTFVDQTNTTQGRWRARQDTLSNRSSLVSLMISPTLYGSYVLEAKSAGGVVSLAYTLTSASKYGLPPAAIAGIVVGSLAVIALIKIVMVLWSYLQQTKRYSPLDTEGREGDDYDDGDSSVKHLIPPHDRASVNNDEDGRSASTSRQSYGATNTIMT